MSPAAEPARLPFKDMKWLLFLLMLPAGPGFAQTRAAPNKNANPAAAPSRWPVENISVEGNHTYTREQILAVAGLKAGEMAGKREFNAARDRLTASGAFETVSYKFVPAANGKGYAATFTVTEVQQVYPIHFEELHVSERDLMAALKAKDPLLAAGRMPATQPVFERYTKWVEEYLAAKGIHKKIVGSVMPDMPGEYAIIFRPVDALPAVAQVSFEGNHTVPQDTLKDAILSVAVGTPYTEDRFRELLRTAVRPVYEARGHVRVSFPTIRTEPAKDVKGVDVLVKVDEGESYTLGKVAIDGPTPIQPDELLKEGAFKTGELANFDKVNEGLGRIRKALRHAGYMEGDVTTSRQIDDDKRIVDVTVFVDAGPQYAMRNLTIVGLDLNGEAEIRRIWTLKPGKPFDPDYPDFFLKRVREDGVFDNLGQTKATYKVDERNHTADVTLTFGGAGAAVRGGRRGGLD